MSKRLAADGTPSAACVSPVVATLSRKVFGLCARLRTYGPHSGLARVMPDVRALLEDVSEMPRECTPVDAWVIGRTVESADAHIARLHTLYSPSGDAQLADARAQLVCAVPRARDAAFASEYTAFYHALADAAEYVDRIHAAASECAAEELGEQIQQLMWYARAAAAAGEAVVARDVACAHGAIVARVILDLHYLLCDAFDIARGYVAAAEQRVPLASTGHASRSACAVLEGVVRSTRDLVAAVPDARWSCALLGLEATAARVTIRADMHHGTLPSYTGG